MGTKRKTLNTKRRSPAPLVVRDARTAKPRAAAKPATRDELDIDSVIVQLNDACNTLLGEHERLTKRLDVIRHNLALRGVSVPPATVPAPQKRHAIVDEPSAPAVFAAPPAAAEKTNGFKPREGSHLERILKMLSPDKPMIVPLIGAQLHLDNPKQLYGVLYKAEERNLVRRMKLKDGTVGWLRA